MFGGFEIGETKCAVVLAEKQSDCINIIFREEFATNNNPKDIIEKMCDMLTLSLVLNGYDNKNLKAVGILCKDLFNSKKEKIISFPNNKSWENVEVCKYVKKRFNKPVLIGNYLDAYALAEWQCGLGQGYNNFIFLSFGLNIKIRLVINGKIYNNSTERIDNSDFNEKYRNSNASIYKIGFNESIYSENEIIQFAREKVLEKLQISEKDAFVNNKEEALHLTSQQVGIFAEKGNKLAICIFDEIGKNIANTLANIIEIYKPEILIFEDTNIPHNNYIQKSVRKYLKNNVLFNNAKPISILSSNLKDRINKYASIILAINGLNTK